MADIGLSDGHQPAAKFGTEHKSYLINFCKIPPTLHESDCNPDRIEKVWFEWRDEADFDWIISGREAL